MFVSQEALNRAHPTSEVFRSGTERKRRSFMSEEIEDHMGQYFLEYGTPLMAVSSFR